MPGRLFATAFAALMLIAGCGEELEPPPDVFAVKRPQGAKSTAFPGAGMKLERPANWKLRRRDAPGVFEILSGEALVAGWAYQRDEPLPGAGGQLEAARERLLAAVRERDPSFQLDGAVATEVAGSPAIELRGRQTISRRPLRTRSVHVFKGDVEYVIEALAPQKTFGRTDRVLAQILRTLELAGKVSEARE